MIVKEFTAENFRNVESAKIEFSPGVNLLYGENAQGKTNVMEGIYFFSRGKSFRSATERELCRIGCDAFRIGLTFADKKRESTLCYSYAGGDRRREKNGYAVSKVTELIDSFHAVLFTPDHLRLVKDGPEERRAFLNIGIAEGNPAYLQTYAAYKRALDERNCLLKMAGHGLAIDNREIYAFSETLAKYAAEIYTARKKYVSAVEKYARTFLSDMTGEKEKLSLSYKSDVFADTQKEAEAGYLKLLTGELTREIGAGTTLYGPHREDMEITLSDKKARVFSSQGQMRSVALALKCAEGEVMREILGEYPVYLFDDVFSELDEKRKSFILDGLDGKQMIITSCEKIGVGDADVNDIEVMGGRYVSSHR